MKQLFRPGRAIAALTMAAAALFAACDDDTAGIGTDVMPKDDIVTTSQATYLITSRTVKADSVLANTNNSYLGCVVDPETRAKTTCNFLAQFNVIENTIYPERSKLLSDADGNILVDSCAVRIFINDYYGDSLTTMKLSAQELDTAKVVSENTALYTNLDASEFLTEGKGVSTTLTYAVKDLSRPDSITNTTHNIVVRLPKEYGRFLVDKYFENPDYYKNSYNFIRHVCPGFYFKTTGGVGSMIHATTSTLDVFFRYHTTENGKDTIVNGMQRMAATEEVIQQTMIDNTIPESMLDEQNEYTYIKSPAGLYTELTLPVDEITAGTHRNDTINSAVVTLSRFNSDSGDAELLDAPENLVMIRADLAYSFFEDGLVPDGYESYITTYNSTYNAYTFSNISRLITALKKERDEGAGVTAADDEAARSAKYAVWEAAHPTWNKVALIPVDATYTSVTSSYTGVTTKTLLSVKNELGMKSVRLNGGPSGNVKIDVIYSRFK